MVFMGRITWGQLRGHCLQKSRVDKSSNSDCNIFQKTHPSLLPQHRRYPQPGPGLEICRGKRNILFSFS